MDLESGPWGCFFNIFLPYLLWSNYISTPLQLLDGKSHSTDSSAKLKTCIVLGLWVRVTTDKQYWRVTESKVNDCNDGRKLYITYTKGVIIIPEIMTSKGFAFFRLSWKLWLYFLRISIKFSNFLTTPYFFGCSCHLRHPQAFSLSSLPLGLLPTWKRAPSSPSPVRRVCLVSMHKGNQKVSGTAGTTDSQSICMIVRRHQRCIYSAASEQQYSPTQQNLSWSLRASVGIQKSLNGAAIFPLYVCCQTFFYFAFAKTKETQGVLEV